MDRQSLEDLQNAIIKEHSVDSVITLLEKTYDFNYTTFHLLRNDALAYSNPFVRTTYPDAWVRRYLLNNYIESDPVIEHVIAEGESFCWSELRPKPHNMEMLKASVAFGLGSSGYTFVYTDDRARCSALSVNSNKIFRDWRDYMVLLVDELEALLPLIHSKGVAEALAERSGVPNLTTREYECLSLSADGESYTTIAARLNLSEHTVRSYLKMARTKLGCTTLAQAVAKAVRKGIL